MTAIALAVSLVIGGCAVKPDEVDVGALEEVRKIGTIIWEKRFEGLMGNDPDVTHIFVLNVGGDTEQESLKKAVTSLRSRSWVISLEDLPTSVFMESSKWNGAHLAMYALSDSDENDDPEVIEAIKKQGVEPGGLISVSAYQGS
ncbi:hypothetical protein ACFOY2_01190 [Nonomuraea purpurea]|uniref:Uncharacterized protein n=1 Tax=Nonomuraea purpurea TaxID=1849276 RepID=A0ABV8FWH3_9ACTN